MAQASPPIMQTRAKTGSLPPTPLRAPRTALHHSPATAARSRAALVINVELIQLYHQIGQDILAWQMEKAFRSFWTIGNVCQASAPVIV
jgi:hypothetical protein